MNLSSTSRTFLALGAAMAFLSVAAGAFGAHGLKQILSNDMIVIWKTAVEYQFFHALGIMLIGLVYQFQPNQLIKTSGWLMFAGIIIFSGSLYILSLSGIRWLGAITPLGGTMFLLAWLIVSYTMIRPVK